MATAEIKMTDGTVISVEGTPAEVAAIITHAQNAKAARRPTVTSGKAKKPRASLSALLEALRTERYFKDKRDLNAIKARLGEMGNHYTGDTLSVQLLREVRARRLRRLQEDGHWIYVQ